MLGVISVVFFLFNVLPGDPSRMMLDQREDSEQLANIKKKYGFDKSVGAQYLHYLNDISPISWHSDNPEDFSHLKRFPNGYLELFSIGAGQLVLKQPYLRESFRYRKIGKCLNRRNFSQYCSSSPSSNDPRLNFRD